MFKQLVLAITLLAAAGCTETERAQPAWYEGTIHSVWSRQTVYDGLVYTVVVRKDSGDYVFLEAYWNRAHDWQLIGPYQNEELWKGAPIKVLAYDDGPRSWVRVELRLSR